MPAKLLIPFSIVPPHLLERWADKLKGIGAMLHRITPNIQLDLENADMDIQAKEYLTSCFISSSIIFVVLSILLSISLSKIGLTVQGFFIALTLFMIIIFFQFKYPKVQANKRVRLLDADLLVALRSMTIYMSSGVPLFEAMTTISNQGFGEVSKELREVVKMISSGVPETEALEYMVLRNPSPYFRMAIWQMINGMKEGASIKDVMKNVIENLSEEQLIQIEKYGSQLNPFAMFYMMGAVILPTLGLTFMIVISSFMGLSDTLLKFVLWGLFCFVTFFQLMFSGIIKSKRPSLLGE